MEVDVDWARLLEVEARAREAAEARADMAERRYEAALAMIRAVVGTADDADLPQLIEEAARLRAGALARG